MERNRSQQNNNHRGHGSFSSPEGLILIDVHCRPVALDSGAVAILRDIDGTSEQGDAKLPQQILNLFGSASQPGTPTAGNVRFAAGAHDYTCRAFSVRLLDGDAPLIALHIKQETSVSEVVRRVATEYHLTDREQEVLIGISRGFTSKELADRMSISPNTVKAFLRLIMIKLGVPTRAGIVGKLIEQNGRAQDGAVRILENTDEIA